MTVEIGRKKQILIGREAVYGTAATSFITVPRGDGRLNPKCEHIKDESGIGTIESPLRSLVLHKWSEPMISGILGDKLVGLLLTGALGTVSTAAGAPEANVNTHSFDVLNANEHPSFTIIEIDGVQTKRVTGCRLQNLELTSEEDFVKFNATFLGKYESASVETATIALENVFLPKHRSVKLASAIAGLAAASAVPMTAVKLTIAKNLEMLWEGSQEPSRILNKTFRVTGDVTLAWEATTYKALWEAATVNAMLFSFLNSDVTIGLISNPKFTIQLNAADITEWTKADGNDDLVMQTLGFEAQYKVAETDMITATVINTQTAYTGS